MSVCLLLLVPVHAGSLLNDANVQVAPTGLHSIYTDLSILSILLSYYLPVCLSISFYKHVRSVLKSFRLIILPGMDLVPHGFAMAPLCSCSRTTRSSRGGTSVPGPRHQRPEPLRGGTLCCTSSSNVAGSQWAKFSKSSAPWAQADGWRDMAAMAGWMAVDGRKMLAVHPL